MGQRLNIEIKKNENSEAMANCYFHWSAYSRDSLTLVHKITKQILKGDNITQEDAVQLLRNIGAKFRTEEGCHRNNGMIATTQEDMEETRMWEEGRITVHCEERTINFECVYDANDREDCEEEGEEDEFLEDTDIAPTRHALPFGDIPNLILLISEAEDRTNGCFRIGDEDLCAIY